jgi:hypothetical protein
MKGPFRSSEKANREFKESIFKTWWKKTGRERERERETA